MSTQPVQPKPIQSEADFTRSNIRRIGLIGKELEGGGLTSKESKELDQLHAACRAFLDGERPLDFSGLRGVEQGPGGAETGRPLQRKQGKPLQP